MSSDLVKRGAEVLKRASARPSAVGEPPERLVAEVRRLLERQRRLRRVVVLGASVALAASLAAVVATGGWRRGAARTELATVVSLSGPAVLTPHSGKAVALTQGMAVDEGALVTTHQGGAAELKLEDGSEVQLLASAELEVQQLAGQQHFRLARGVAHIHVQKRPGRERFVVTTEDVEIEVHGTRFVVEDAQVDAACDVATSTRVTLTEGEVLVRHGADQVRLSAPALWPDCSRTEAALEPAAPAVDAPPPLKPRPPAGTARRPSLSELNARYREAIAARRRGDIEGALELFRGFYAAHPGSQLAEAARVEELRLLAKQDDGRARPAAAAYLDAYPRGFARDEAKAMLGP